MSDVASAPLIDRRQLDDYAAVLPGDQVRRLIDAFRYELATRPAIVLSLARDGGVADARAAAHLLRGAALNLGACRLAALAGAVEAAQADDIVAAAAALPACALATLADLARVERPLAA